MISHNFAIYGTRVIAGILTDILYFPIWWYTKGLYKISVNLIRFLSTRQQALGFFVWLKNIFTPMYGQQDFAGSLISFVIRLVQIIFRGSLMLFWLVVSFICLLIWLALPLVVASEVIYQLIPPVSTS